MPSVQAERAIAVVRIEPVVAGAQVHAGRVEHGLVAGAADLEEDQALVLELDLLVVEPPRQQHRAVGAEQILARQTVPFAGARPFGARVGNWAPSVEAFMTPKLYHPVRVL